LERSNLREGGVSRQWAWRRGSEAVELLLGLTVGRDGGLPAGLCLGRRIVGLAQRLGGAVPASSAPQGAFGASTSRAASRSPARASALGQRPRARGAALAPAAGPLRRAG
jgi:hypothetical protein